MVTTARAVRVGGDQRFEAAWAHASATNGEITQNANRTSSNGTRDVPACPARSIRPTAPTDPTATANRATAPLMGFSFESWPSFARSPLRRQIPPGDLTLSACEVLMRAAAHQCAFIL